MMTRSGLILGSGLTLGRTCRNESEDTCVGSTEIREEELWVYEGSKMVFKKVSYVPSFYKIFEEVLLMAIKNAKYIEVDIDDKENLITVYNDGGLSVEMRRGKVYLPETTFGDIGLTNLFSKEFILETTDAKNKKKFKQVVKNGTTLEPTITSYKGSGNSTRVAFRPDLNKYNMLQLDDDIVGLMKRRVVDLAGCLGKSMRVVLNGDELNVKSFEEYVKLYLKASTKRGAAPLPCISQKLNNQLEVCLSLSDGKFQQVSFANNFATTEGGNHVDPLTNQVITHVLKHMNKTCGSKSNVTPTMVKNHLWIFVNALTTGRKKLGMPCQLSPGFLKEVINSGLVERLLHDGVISLTKVLKNTNEAERKRPAFSYKIEDANNAGHKVKSSDCTLIITEGVSAAALVRSGLCGVGRDNYGIFPLRGKPLNVRDANDTEVMQNKDIQNLQKILGLQKGMEYKNTNTLRYGHVMIMTDQDYDGFHIKGLIINLFHVLWKSLLKIPSFLLEFVTPIVKARNKVSGEELYFYSIPEFDTWKKNVDSKSWERKYYKGLATSNQTEGKEYFTNYQEHCREFLPLDEADTEMIDMVFSKKRTKARKNWIKNYQPGTFLDRKENTKISDVLNKEVIQYSIANLRRALPSMLDGLKPSQRKCLFYFLENDIYKEGKVADFAGCIARRTEYQHDSGSLNGTMIRMAHDYVGSNNINLLVPSGIFGTPAQRGKDHGRPGYLNTYLSPLTRLLFPRDDDILLDYKEEEDKSVEPKWYMPIIPTVLVNGCEGLAIGWRTSVPNFNPIDLIAMMRRLLQGEPIETQTIIPWYKGFEGAIESSLEKKGVFISIGCFEQLDKETVRIVELPVHKWREGYKETLEKLARDSVIKAYSDQSTDSIDIMVRLSKKNLRPEDIVEKLKLTSEVSTNNMYLFDEHEVLKKYENPVHVLRDFFKERLLMYGKRKEKLLEHLQLRLRRKESQIKFLHEIKSKQIELSDVYFKKRTEIESLLHKRGYVAGFPELSRSDEEGSVEERRDYDYLLSVLKCDDLTGDDIPELHGERDRLRAEVQLLALKSPEELWLQDLSRLEDALHVEETEGLRGLLDTAREAARQRKRLRRR